MNWPIQLKLYFLSFLRRSLVPCGNSSSLFFVCLLCTCPPPQNITTKLRQANLSADLGGWILIPGTIWKHSKEHLPLAIPWRNFQGRRSPPVMMATLCKGQRDLTLHPAEMSWAKPHCFCLRLNNAGPAGTSSILTYYVSRATVFKSAWTPGCWIWW